MEHLPSAIRARLSSSPWSSPMMSAAIDSRPHTAYPTSASSARGRRSPAGHRSRRASSTPPSSAPTAQARSRCLRPGTRRSSRSRSRRRLANVSRSPPRPNQEAGCCRSRTCCAMRRSSSPSATSSCRAVSARSFRSIGGRTSSTGTSRTATFGGIGAPQPAAAR